MTKPRRTPTSRTLVVLAEDAGISAARWLLIGPDRGVLVEGRLRRGDAMGPPVDADRTVLIVPGQDVAVRRLDLGLARPAQARGAALRQLAEDMGRDPASLVGAVGVGATSMRLSAAVDRTVLEGWLGGAAGFGLRPDVVLPDSLVPQTPMDHDWTALTLFDRVTVRGVDAAFTAEPELAAAVTGKDRVAWILDDAAVVQAIIEAALDPPLNLLDGAMRSGGGWRSWRRAAILAVALALAPLAMIAAEAIRFELIAGGLERRSNEAVRAAWPDTPRGAEPADEVRRRLGPALTGGFSKQAAVLFTAIEAVDGAELDSLVMDDAGQLRAAVGHRDYADLERLNAALAEQGFGLTEDSVIEENGRMVSDILVSAP